MSGAHRRDPNEPPFVPPEGPPKFPAPRDVYAKMGEEAVFRMLRDFYAELERSSIRAMFPEDMVEASEKSAAFFVAILGGPPLYHQRYGPPMMRGRHLPFRIDEAARQVWLGCFRKTLEGAEAKYGFPKERLPEFLSFLDAFSRWMVNTG